VQDITWDSTGPAETRQENAARLTQSVCDEFGAGLVAGLAIGLIAAETGSSREIPVEQP
jgi:predicted lipid-binding transport protein (Tim44 family)